MRACLQIRQVVDLHLNCICTEIRTSACGKAIESPVAAAVVGRGSWEFLCHCFADASHMQMLIGVAFKGAAASGAASSQLLAQMHRTVLPLTCCT